MRLTDPVGYLDMLAHQRAAAAIVTALAGRTGSRLRAVSAFSGESRSVDGEVRMTSR
ncbi:MAG: hypothetical protein WBI91_01045 [Coriobacteriia bacterium]